MHDIVIRAGTILDGTGFEAFAGDLAIDGDRIVAVGGKLGPGRRYQYIYSKCTGCAVCFWQCPCHAIEMIPEPT